MPHADRRSRLVPLAFTFLSIAALALASIAVAQEGALLYDRESFDGFEDVITGDVADMERSRLGNDRLRSIRIAPGCRATLYADAGFRGRSTTLEGDVADLGRTPVGSDSVSSIRLECRDGSGSGGWDDPWSDSGSRDSRDGWGDDRRDDDRRDDDRRDDDRRDDWEDPWGRDGEDDRRRNDPWGGGWGSSSGDRSGDDRRLRSLRPGAGVLLYSDADFRGRSELVTRDESTLSDNAIGNDRVSSLRVAPGCRATLYSDQDFRGRSFSTERDVADLSTSPIGGDRLSSMRVDCRSTTWGDRGPHGDRDHDWGGWKGTPGAILYSDLDFGGRKQLFTQDVDDLGRSSIGNDSASSIRVAPGCQATLYENQRFTGRSSVFEDDARDLRGSRVGNDSVSSLTVRCRGVADVGDDFGWGRGVVLFHDTDFRGTKVDVANDIPDMSRSTFGNDRASSIRVSVGCEATLYSNENYRGRSVRLTGDVENLGETPLGNDSLSSIEVRCRRR